MKIKPYKHQQKVLDNNPKKYGLFFEGGLGKSFTALWLAEMNNVNCIITCPKTIKRQWENDIKMFKQKHLVLTKEEFKKYKNEIGYYAGFINDESHKTAGATSIIQKSITNWIKQHNPTHVWCLSATPLTSNHWSIYHQANFMGWNLNYSHFRKAFFIDISKEGEREKWIQKKDKKTKQRIAKFINKIGTVIKMNEVVDVPKQNDIYENIALTKQQEKAIKKQWESDYSSAVNRPKVHQIEQGVLKSDGGYTDEKIFKDLKTERVKELFEENKKIIVFCRFSMQIDKIYDAIKTKNKWKITGDTKDRVRIFEKADALEESLLVIQSDICEGYNLPSFRTVVFASCSHTVTNYKQAKWRTTRLNNLTPTNYYHLISDYDGSIDKSVDKCLQNGENYYYHIHKESKKTD